MTQYLFYDIETSGLNPTFDQILTFAAIRTDAQFREIERHELMVRLRPDVVPSPGAFVTHRLALEHLAEGMHEYEAACIIHEMVNRPGTISLGYNSLGFDDLFLRFTFYRNLLSPYSHQFAEGCGRMDLLPPALLYRLFMPGDLKWPMVDGRPSMKLEWISRENQLVNSGRAHEAMTDVEATLALARRMAIHERMWSFCRSCFDPGQERRRLKGLGTRRLGQLGTFPVGIMVSTAFGPDTGYLSPVLGLGMSRVYPNQSLWLRLDTGSPLTGSEADPPGEHLVVTTNHNTAMVVRKKNGDNNILLPWLDRFAARLSRRQRQVCDETLALMSENTELTRQWMDEHLNYAYPAVPDLDVDASLYQDGFFSRLEKKEIRRFHKAYVQEGMPALGRMTCQRIRKLAARLVFRNSDGRGEIGNLLPYGFNGEKYLARLRAGSAHERPILGMNGLPRYGPADAKTDLAHLKSDSDLDSEQLEILASLYRYLEKM